MTVRSTVILHVQSKVSQFRVSPVCPVGERRKVMIETAVMIENAAATFEKHRGRLTGLAYRMLGSRADAEDVVQEAYVRWHQAEPGSVENPEAWLVTATSRLAIDRLRRLKTEREAYIGPWLPEPIVTAVPPDRHLDLAEDLSMA